MFSGNNWLANVVISRLTRLKIDQTALNDMILIFSIIVENGSFNDQT